MWLILLEALAALAVLIFIVWWTMFAGRTRVSVATMPTNDPPAADR